MLVTFYILAYNHEDFILEAINSALAQTYTPLQIIISDDCSSDATWEIIKKKASSYAGPHNLMVRRNSRNLGISAHINAVWQECKGDWIIAAGGDDTSLANRVEKIIDAAEKYCEVKLIQSWLNEIDETGNLVLVNTLQVKAQSNNVKLYTIQDRLNGASYAPHGAAMAYRRELFTVFDPLPADVIFEDNIINLRAELLGKAAVLLAPLVNHRNHTGQITRGHGDISAEKREIRRMQRLISDIGTSKQNLSDSRRAVCSLENNKKTVEAFCKKKLLEARLRKFAIVGPWPFKVFALCIIKLTPRPEKLSRDDFVRAMFPYIIYRAVKGIRNRSENGDVNN